MRALASNFRCTPRQSRVRASAVKPGAVIAALQAAFRRPADAELRDNLKNAFQSLLDKKTVAGILYERFRNSAVHGLKVDVDEPTFFAAQEPHWRPLYSEHYPPFLLLTFPAAFLVKLLRTCLGQARRHLATAQKLPPDVHFQVFGAGMDSLEFLDERLVPKGRDLQLRTR